MRRGLLSVALLCAVATSSLSACAAPGPSVNAAYEAAVEGVIKKSGAVGMVAAVWVPGRAPWRMAFGLADAASQRPMGLDDHFPVRSITKSFTVTVLLQLARDGLLSLDETIARHVEEFRAETGSR